MEESKTMQLDENTLPCYKARWACKRLTVYSSLKQDPIFAGMTRLLDLLCSDDSQVELIVETYSQLFSRLSAKTEMGANPMVGNAWQNHLLDLILGDENTFSRKAELVPLEKMGSALREAVVGDLRCLQMLFLLDSQYLVELVLDRLEAAGETGEEGLFGFNWPTWDQLKPLPKEHLFAPNLGKVVEMKQKFLFTPDWGSCLLDLSQYYQEVGCGQFGLYWAFRWEQSGGGQLVGIANPDSIRFSNLVGYETQRQQVIENTEQFLAGYPANNILLYGDRGTGKSSTVKALLHQFGPLGLRLVEISKDQLTDFNRVVRQLRDRPQKFIIFIDDLSFEDFEPSYKCLKAVLEGSLESQPANVLIYATSNRRHLVKEYFSDRQASPSNTGGEEVRRQETMEEKLSLADRFGITVTFISPNQEQYLAIVEELAAQRGISLPKEELHQLAVRWEMRHNGRSGRTARQFIDHLSGKLGVKATE